MCTTCFPCTSHALKCLKRVFLLIIIYAGSDPCILIYTLSYSVRETDMTADETTFHARAK